MFLPRPSSLAALVRSTGYRACAARTTRRYLQVVANEQGVGTASSSSAAVERLDHAVRDMLAQRPDAAENADRALAEDPGLVLGHALCATMHFATAQYRS